MKIQTWLLVVSGFRQRLGGRNGSADLWTQLRRYESPTTEVEWLTWKSPWKDVAEKIDAHSSQFCDIAVFAYSWGAGYGFQQLAKQLDKRNRRINTAVLCDPVYRSRLMSLRWLALTSWMSLPVPTNVDDIRTVYQRNNRPQGHLPQEGDDAGTTVHPAIEVNARHETIDSHSVYHMLCLHEADKLVSQN